MYFAIAVHLAGAVGCAVWITNRLRTNPWLARAQSLRRWVVVSAVLVAAIAWEVAWPWLWWQTRHDDGKVP